MFLTREEEAVLKGEYGEGLEIAMSVLVKLGEIYGADKMVAVESVHIDGSAYGWIYDAGLEFVEKLCYSGINFKVPTTLNPSSIDFEMWRAFKIKNSVARKQFRLAEAFKRMGATPTWTCTPYQCGANLRYGQNIAWGESNAIGFANTVIGARTERLGDLADVCAAIVGKYPHFGLYLDENRRGQILFKLNELNTESFTYTDYGVLGFYVGSIAKARVPVLTGIPENVKLDQLKAFCAAAAVGGSVALSHICGVTPDAKTIAEACGGVKPEEKICVDISELNKTREKLSTRARGRPDVVCIGCPHCSLEELVNVSNLLRSRKVKGDIEFLVFTSRMVKALAREMGIIDMIESAGGKVIADTCWKFIPLEGRRILMTDSAKMAWVSLQKFSDVILDGTKECVETAVEAKC
ncbi:MAG: aconitase X catalytic domain-containing protein [Candidatus Bathyarchaeia archaeon]